MLKKTGLALLLLAATAAQAHAEYQCSVKPQDDVIISPQSVQVKGASGDLQISPDGDVIRNGQALSLNGRKPSATRARCASSCRGSTTARSSTWRKPARRWIR